MEKENADCSHSPPRNTFDTCTRYIDSSKAVLDHYQNRRLIPGQEKHIHKINGWLEEESDQALVFRTEPGCGMKTILSQWEKGIRLTNADRKQKILTITHFASGGSNDSNYFYCLYQIIVKLKDALKLKQSVDLLEENIRKFFAYWLDMVSCQVEKQQVIYCSQEIYQKVVIVIEAVDRLTDQETGREANIAFWLPEKFPKNVKVIVTARRHSESIQHLERIGCQLIDIKTDIGIADAIHGLVRERTTCLTEETTCKYQNVLEQLMNRVTKSNNVYSFLQFYSGVFLPREGQAEWTEHLEKKMDPSAIEGISNINQLYNLVIENSTENIMLQNKYQLALVFLSLAQKGLTGREVQTLTKLSENQWQMFLGIFGCVIMNYQGVFLINSRWLVESVLERQKNKKGQGFGEVVMGWHERIARTLEGTENSIRKLQEQAFHLFCAKSYFRLKEMVSNIQNFLLLFNPHNKYELSRYWQKLQEKGFDPVIEYNKAVEGFSMHYHPSDQNTFRIIVQISRFLKQFCDFQTYDTPSFRHPFIEGNMLELNKIGLLSELSSLDIYIDNSFNPPSSLECETSLEQQIQDLKERCFPKDIQKSGDLGNRLNQPQVDCQLTKHRRKNQFPKILSEIEQLNVDVPMNRNKFRQEYLRNIRELMKKEEDLGWQGRGEGGYLDVEEASSVLPPCPHPLSALSFQKIKENYRLREIKPSLYYYKRWIWIQFPWICISLNNNYSTTPELKKNIEGDDNDFTEDEYKYTKQSLMVAIEARQKKRQMFSKKDPFSTPKPCKPKHHLFQITKHQSNRLGMSVQKLRSSPHFDLSLQTLSKQLQSRQAHPSSGGKQLEDNRLLGELKQNCEQEMKFISLRRQFQCPSLGTGEVNELLPKVKWAIKEHTNYELQYMKSHIEDKKKKLNRIIYDNKRLGDIYQELRIKEALTKKNIHEQEEEKSGKKSKALDDLLKKKEEVITEFCKSLLQKERLKIILKLCSENKTRNEEYLASLNYFLQNLKKMISYEKQNMKQISQDLQNRKASTQKRSTLEREQSQNRRVVEQEMQNYLQEKVQLQAQIQNIHQTIWEDIQDQKDKIEDSLSGHIKCRQEKNQIKEQEKTIRHLEDKLQRVSKDYQMLQELFELGEGQEGMSTKMSKLLHQHQRNKQLKITYFEKRNRLQELQRELVRVKEENERQIQRQLKKMGVGKAEKKEKQIVKNPQDRKLQIMLDNLCLKLGVHDRKDIIGVLQKKVKSKAKGETCM